MDALGLHRDEVDRFYPNVKILLADLFLYGVNHFRPNIFHVWDLDGLGHKSRAICKIGKGGLKIEKIIKINLL
jgi:hypothetical protein